MTAAQPVPPSGTVTFLFTDVVGSTRLWANDLDAMSVSLRLHDRLVNEAIGQHDGYVFSTAGDSFAVAFSSVASAVDCASDIQGGLASADWGVGHALAVRIGMHRGVAEERDGNYFGPTLNLAARAMAAAHGGQCVLTDVVQAAADAQVTDLGEHQLRDIETPVHLYQLGTGTFPALSSIGIGIVSLPSPRTSLIGRQEAVTTVRQLVAEERLVTLTGVGGCGKTRLAIEVAHQECSAHPDGVWFVDLGSSAPNSPIEGAFVVAVDVKVDDQTSVIDQLVAYLAPRDAVLVVDNCEHVIGDAAELVDGLLDRCPKLRVLATSREPLEIYGERIWKVPPLGTDTDSAARHLFVERATAVGAAVASDPTTVRTIDRIVERLDGIPLAIELAAARTRSMNLIELDDRLDDRFRILSGNKRGSGPRQATLETAVQWSYDLLNEDERSMLRALSVFQGGFSLNDVAAVAGRAEHDAIELVDGLVAKSLIDVTGDDQGQIRHRLLETIRLFALARLVNDGEIEAARDRHLDCFLNDWSHASMNERLDIRSERRTEQEFQNFRSAAAWSVEQGVSEATVRLGAMLSETMAARGEAQTALEWLGLSTDLTGRDLVFTRAILAGALLAHGDVEGAITVANEAIEAARNHRCDDIVQAMAILNAAESVRGNHDLAQRVLGEAREIAQSFGPNVQATTDLYWVFSCMERGRTLEALTVVVRVCEQAPTFSLRYLAEAVRAFILVMLDRIEEADRVVRSFSEMPPSSWTHIRDIVANTVLVHTQGPDAAARSLAVVAQDAVARRPELFVDFLQGFAYAAYFRSDYQRAREIAFNTLPLGAGWVQAWIIHQLYEASSETAEQIRRDFDTEHPWDDLLAFTQEHGMSLYTEELTRNT